jgi:hypothetical protein
VTTTVAEPTTPTDLAPDTEETHMHHLYTLIALDIARERSAEAARERLGHTAQVELACRTTRPTVAARVRLAVRALAGTLPEPAPDATSRPATAPH